MTVRVIVCVSLVAVVQRPACHSQQTLFLAHSYTPPPAARCPALTGWRIPSLLSHWFIMYLHLIFALSHCFLIVCVCVCLTHLQLVIHWQHIVKECLNGWNESFLKLDSLLGGHIKSQHASAAVFCFRWFIIVSHNNCTLPVECFHLFS